MDNGFQNNMNMDKLTKDEMIMMLMDLLKQNNMQKKSNVMYETAAYIDVLESKLDQMSKELTAMRKKLVEMDNKTLATGIKDAINKSITKSQITINDMKEKVHLSWHMSGKESERALRRLTKQLRESMALVME